MVRVTLLWLRGQGSGCENSLATCRVGSITFCIPLTAVVEAHAQGCPFRKCKFYRQVWTLTEEDTTGAKNLIPYYYLTLRIILSTSSLSHTLSKTIYKHLYWPLKLEMVELLGLYINFSLKFLWVFMSCIIAQQIYCGDLPSTCNIYKWPIYSWNLLNNVGWIWS